MVMVCNLQMEMELLSEIAVVLPVSNFCFDGQSNFGRKRQKFIRKLKSDVLKVVGSNPLDAPIDFEDLFEIRTFYLWLFGVRPCFSFDHTSVIARQCYRHLEDKDRNYFKLIKFDQIIQNLLKNFHWKKKHVYETQMSTVLYWFCFEICATNKTGTDPIKFTNS